MSQSTKTGRTVAGCWAGCLLDCAGKLSREHYISDSFFSSESITVRGMPWCKDEPVTIGLKGFVAKHLCERHNSLLGIEVDAIAADSLNTLAEAIRLIEVRKRYQSRHWNVHRFLIDGWKLERWFLKTLINLTIGSPYVIGVEPGEIGMPNASLVRISFGLERFQGDNGLCLVAEPGENIQVSERIQFAALTDEANNRINGGIFSFCGYRFMLNFTGHALKASSGASVLHHEVKQWFTTKDDRGRDVKSHLITIKF